MRVSVERLHEAPAASPIRRFQAAFTHPIFGKMDERLAVGNRPQASVRPPELPGQAEDQLAARNLGELREPESLQAVREGSGRAAPRGTPAIAAKREQESGGERG